ncbi:olfactory receptor 6M1 [Equus przewalskii]|uniref:Olfactory receptor n=2 Tax=Equus TaxID=9789 RepID=F7AE50_HORSE|nr:olfactory receptor family 6 subfamily M member 1 [Equus caballus]XP_001501653.2 olfactory receptor 6M1 [Equus caballus]XP_008516966.1 PREDICTED: olfactory receptor 6M1 [Equus przewalskii]
MGNWSTVTEFTLTAFPAFLELRILLFVVLLLTYTLTATGNIIILSLIWTDNRLQTPMYFFLSNLSFLDILFTTTIVPKLLACLLEEKKTIPFAGCIIQVYFYFFLGTVEFILLAVMSFDRYVAICNPLRYTIIMNSRTCLLLVLGCWLGAFLSVLVPIIVVTRLPYCSKEINHFFCDIAPLLQAACVDTHLIEKMNFLLSALVILSSLAFTTGSYTYIISTILHIPSAQGREKAFSTCASHITVVSIAYGSNIFVYVRPNQNYSLNFDKIAAILITVVTPLLNPFIYSLRNEKVKEVLREAMDRIMSLILRKTRR